MKNMRSISLMVIVGLLAMCTLISVSYAFYTVLPTESRNVTSNVTLPSCATLALSGTSTVSISGYKAAPVQDFKVLATTEYEYSFTVKNNCATQTSIIVALVPTTASTMQIGAVKYAIKESTGSYPTSGSFLNANPVTLSTVSKSDIKLLTGTEYSTGYKVLTATLAANTTKSYKLSVWIDYDEGGLADNATMDRKFASYVVISDEL